MKSRLKRVSWTTYLSFCLLLGAAQQMSGAALIEAKAWMAPILIGRAWQRSLHVSAAGVKPWPWADTWPIARLRAPSLNIERYVLASDSGQALAFGPGHVSASAAPGSAGLAVIAGHRDTHFKFLPHLGEGDTLELQLVNGQWRKYRLGPSRVVNADEESLPIGLSDTESLLLVTCYPFNSLHAGGPLRYVVRATPQ